MQSTPQRRHRSRVALLLIGASALVFGIASGTVVGASPSAILRAASASAPAVRISMSSSTTSTTPSTPTPTGVRPSTSSTTVRPGSTSTTVVGGRLLGCAVVPSVCGYPDGSNTGPGSGVVLRRVPSEVRSGSGWAWSDRLGGVQVTGTGAVLDGLDIAGAVVIDAPNVTVSNSRISACGGVDDTDVVAVRYKASDASYQGANARVVRNVIVGTPAGCSHRARSGVRDIYGSAPGMYVDGNNISGVGNGITAEYEATVVNNWIHDLGHLAGDHHSGISSHGGAKQLVWKHNTVLLFGQSFPGGGGVSGALTVYADFGHAQNVRVEDNLISGGSYVVYGGNSGDSYSTPSTNVQFVSNRFVCNAWLYGPVAAFSASSPGNLWTDNYCDQNGTTVNS